MDIRQLQYFVTVVQEKSVTAAAKQLNLTQPPLTSQLHGLEDELGCSLFRRSGRRLYLTEAGQHLYDRAVQILGMCDTTKREIADFRDGSAGTLRVGVVSSVQGSLFMEMLDSFHSSCPGVRLSIHSANTYELLDMLPKRQIDLALVRTPFPSDGLQAVFLRREGIMAVGHKRYFPGGVSPVTFKELSGVPLIIYRRWQKVIEAGFESAGLRPQIFCVNDDAAMTLLLAKHGMGVGLLHPSAVQETLTGDISLLPVAEDSLVSEIALVCPDSEQLPITGGLFWKMAESIYAQGGFTGNLKG